MKREVTFDKKSITFGVYTAIADIDDVMGRIKFQGGFSPAPNPADTDPGIVRDSIENDPHFIAGTYAIMAAFEVESFSDGLHSSEIRYRIETCEFLISERCVLLWGSAKAKKIAEDDFWFVFGIRLEKLEPSQGDLRGFHDALETVKKVQVENEEGEVRKVSLSGKIEDYSHFDTIQGAHILKSVSGTAEISEHAIGVQATIKGDVKISVSFAGVDVSFETIFRVIGMLNPGIFERSVFGSAKVYLEDEKENGTENPGEVLVTDSEKSENGQKDDSGGGDFLT